MHADIKGCKESLCAVSQPFLPIFASEYGWIGGVGWIEGRGEE